MPFLIDPAWAPALCDVIQHQDDIGWKPFLEGLPSKPWQHYITTQVSMPSTHQTSSTWIVKLLRAAHMLAWSRWEHCNMVLHQTDQPRQRKAEQTLINTLIVSELTTGPLSLPPTDHHYFQQPLGHLLFQSLPFRQAWYSCTGYFCSTTTPAAAPCP